MFKNPLVKLLTIVFILSMVLAACQPAPAPEATTAPEAAPAEEATTAPAEEAAPPEAAASPCEMYQDAPREDTAIFDIDGGKVVDPELWNMFVPGNRRDQGFHQAVMEPLFMLNYETGEIEPWLGESMTANATQDEWTLKLKPGIEWSDGQPMTADDVVFTFQMLLDNDPPTLDNAATFQEWIKSVEKVDDLTVKFTLNKPNPRFQLDYFSVRIWGGTSVQPKHIWEGQDPMTFKNYDPAKGYPIYSGPYVLCKVSETEFIYARNDNWWGAKTGFQKLPEPKKLVWVWYGPEETRAAAMADNNLDSLMDITLGALQALQAKNPNVITHYKEAPFAWVPDPCSRTFEFNTAKEPWNDPKVRWAVAHLINREQIVKIAYEGTTFPSKHFFPAYPPLDRLVKLLEDKGMYEKYPLLEYNPDKFKTLIEEAGWVMGSDGYYAKDGKQLAMDITTHEAFIEKQRIAAVLVEEFQKAGINATTRNEAGNTWGDNFNMGNFDTRMGWQTCGSVNEPWASLDQFNVKWLKPIGERASANSWRWSGPNAEAFSKIVDEIGVLPLGDPKVDELFVQAMDYWFQDLPVIPVTQAKKIIPFNTTYWTNWPTAENPYIHPPTWWQHTLRILVALKKAGS